MTRRWGTGSLEQLPSGAWRARIPVGGGQTLKKTFDTKPEAREWLDEQVGKRTRGAGGRRPNATLAELRQEFLDDLKRAGRRDTTLNRMESHVDVVLKDHGASRLRDIDGPYLERAVEAWMDAGLANATVRNRIGVLTGLTRYGQRRGYVAAVPLPVRRPKVGLETRREILSPEQLDALLDAARESDDPRHLLVIGLGYWGGLRRGEMIPFRRSHLDAKRREIMVVASKTGQQGPVPIPRELVDAIVAVPVPPDDGPLLRLPSASALSHWIAPLWWGAGLDRGVSLHRLRHTGATHLGKRRATLATLMAWGRWTTFQAARIYLHEDAAVDRRAIDQSTRFPRGTGKQSTPTKKARKRG